MDVTPSGGTATLYARPAGGSQHLWDHLTQAVQQILSGSPAGEMEGKRRSIPKMAPENDPKVFLNTFTWLACIAGWPEDQWTLILVLCL